MSHLKSSLAVLLLRNGTLFPQKLMVPSVYFVSYQNSSLGSKHHIERDGVLQSVAKSIIVVLAARMDLVLTKEQIRTKKYGCRLRVAEAPPTR